MLWDPHFHSVQLQLKPVIRDWYMQSVKIDWQECGTLAWFCQALRCPNTWYQEKETLHDTHQKLEKTNTSHLKIHSIILGFLPLSIFWRQQDMLIQTKWKRVEKQGHFTSTDSEINTQLSKVILATREDNLCKPKEKKRSFKIHKLELKSSRVQWLLKNLWTYFHRDDEALRNTVHSSQMWTLHSMFQEWVV